MDTSASSPQYLTVIQPRVWTENRHYRLYVLPQELVFVWAGNAADISRVIMMAQGGLVGGLLAAATHPRRKNVTRAEELESKPLDELRGDHKHNFVLHADELSSARLVKAGFWFKVNFSTVRQSGLLRVKPHQGKELTFAICKKDDVRTAAACLPPVLGPKLSVEIALPLK